MELRRTILTRGATIATQVSRVIFHSDAAERAKQDLIGRSLDALEVAARSNGYAANVEARHDHVFTTASKKGGTIEFHSSFFSSRHFGARKGEGKDPMFFIVIKDAGNPVVELVVSSDADVARASRLYRMMFEGARRAKAQEPLDSRDPLVRAGELV